MEERVQALREELKEKGVKFESEKAKMREMIQQIKIINHELTKKQTEYENIYHTM